MPAVLLSIDFFNLGAFKEPTTVDYPKKNDTGDKPALYVVLQPLIMVGNTLEGLPAARWLYGELAEYLSATSPPLIGDDDHPIVMPGDYMDAAQGWPIGQLRSGAIPVPFPPQTSFDFKLVFASAASTVTWEYSGSIPSQVLEGQQMPPDSSLLLPRDQWPSVGAASFVLPTIDDIDKLAPNQRLAVIDWLTAAVAHLRAARLSNQTLTVMQRSIFDTYINRDQVLDPVLPPDKKDDTPNQPEVIQVWRDYLINHADGKRKARLLYRAFLLRDPEISPTSAPPPGVQRFDAPRFRYDSANPASPTVYFPDDASGKKVIAGSYHHLLWREFAGQIAAASNDEEKDHAKRALQRLYGFGERLRWLKSTVGGDPLAAANKRLMVIETDSARLPGGFGTNVHSLAGQVFRVDNVDAMTGGPYTVSVERFLINGQPPVWHATKDAQPDSENGQGPARLAHSIESFLSKVKQHSSDTFSVRLAGDPGNPNGLSLFQPKMADLRLDPEGMGLELPRSLLDASTPDVPFSMPPDTDRLVLIKPARRGLPPSELLAGEALFQDSATNRGRGIFRLRVRLVKRRRFGTEQPTVPPRPLWHVYDIALSEKFADLEQQLIDAVFGGQIEPRRLSLWIPQKTPPTKTIDLSPGDLLHSSAGGLHPLPLLRVVSQTKIQEIDRAVADFPGSDTATGFAIYLAIDNLEKDEPFNVVPTAVLGDRRLIALSRAFTSRVSASADRLLARLETLYEPSPFAADDPVLGHFANFNKTRLALQSASGDWTLMTYPDAVLPMRTHADDPSADPVKDPLGAGRDIAIGGPHFSYPLVHYFDRELDESETGDSGDSGGDLKPRKSEQIRYQLVRSPGTRKLGGYVEHQYSARIAVSNGQDVDLKLGHDTRNPADLHADKAEAASRRAIHLLTFSSNLAALTLTLSFSAEYVQALFTEAWSGGDDSPRKVQDAYRAIYETMADLEASLAAGLCELLVEGWAFDSSSRPFDAPDANLPAFFSTMVRVATGRLALDRNIGVRDALKAVIVKFLGPDYETFKSNVERIRSGAAPLTPVQIRLNAGEWSWKDPGGNTYNPAALDAEAHLLRVGLFVRRDPATTITTRFGDSRFLPFAISDDLRQRAAWPTTGTDSGFAVVTADAQAELKAYLGASDGPLYRKFSWLACKDRFATPSDTTEAFESSLRVHFGEAVGFLDVPRSQMPAIERVTDLYYVPYGLLPIGRHPMLPDPIVTLEFAFYIARLMQAIRDGTPFEGIGTTLADVKTAEEAQRRIAYILERKDGFSDQVVSLVRRVDNAASIKASHPEAELKVYKKVDGLLSAIDPEGTVRELRRKLRTKFISRPADFADLRGLGIVIFDPDRFSRQLYSIRINKRIREDLADLATQGLARNDVDEFLYSDIVEDAGQRFLVDALDEERYDAEFSIEQNRYVVDGALIDDHRNTSLLGDVREVKRGTPPTRYVALRGDTQARTAEDIIEADLDSGASSRRRYQPDELISAWNSDPPLHPKPGRSLEANMVHFNPAWRVRTNQRVMAWQYLLPSRRPPGQPTLLTPKQVLTGGKPNPDLSPIVSTVFLPRGGDPGSVDLFKTIAGTKLKERAVVAAEKADTESKNDPLTLELIAGFSALAEKPEQCKGWHAYDTVLAHHYFLVEADPDATSVDPIQQDAISIEVDQSVTDAATSATTGRTVAVAGAPALSDTVLYQWFLWDRLRHQRGDAERPKVSPTLQELVDQIYQTLGFDPTGQPLGLGESILRERSAPDTGSLSKPTIFLPVNQHSKLVWPTAGSGSGQVVAAETMKVTSDPLVGGGISRYVVRVTTIESPWYRTRVRVRLLRNYRDVNADLVNDIDSKFLMASPFSEWSERVDRSLVYGPADFIRESTEVGWILKTPIKRVQWMAVDPFLPDDDSGRVMDFGPMLRELIATEVPHHPQYRMWGREAEEIGTISALIEHQVPDAHTIHGADARLDRSHRVARQILVGDGGHQVTWDDVDVLTKRIDKKLVVSAQLQIRFTWYNKRGERLLQVTLPVTFAT